MTIFVIDDQDRVGVTLDLLKPHADKVVLLERKEKEIEKYSEILDDDSPKILAISPGNIEWKLPNTFLRKVKNLKGIGTKSAWAYYIDLEFCKNHGIAVTNCPGANSQSVAEYAILMMLALARKLPLQIRENFKVAWDNDHEQEEVAGKTMAILGLGNIGGRIARMGQGLGMKVVYWSRNKKEVPYDYMTMDQALKQADFVFNCLETCEETKGLLGKEKLDLVKKSTYFISVLGGMGFGVQDDNYLLQMVKEKRLTGFSVENENEHDTDFPKSPEGNVFIPGAYAWFTKEAGERTNKIWADGIIGIIKGDGLYKVV